MTLHLCDTLDLDALRSRTGAKWNHYPADVLPLWVAEMDYPLAEPIKQAVRARLDRDDLGYGVSGGIPGLREAVAHRMAARYGYRVAPEQVVGIDSTVHSMRVAVETLTEPGDEILINTPLYPPFKMVIEGAGRVAVEVEMVDAGDAYRYDMAALDAAVTPKTRMLMICSPHNPLGRVFDEHELGALAEFVLRHDLLLVSDELHADLTFSGGQRAIAGLRPDLATRTVTLYGPTKAFNLPGMQISFIIAGNDELKERLGFGPGKHVGGPNVLAQEAALAAFTQCDDWLDSVLAYLRRNRDQLASFVSQHLPGVTMHLPEATYLAWLDLRGAGLGDEPAKALLERAKVGLNEGMTFGRGGAGHVRLNFATSSEILTQGLERIRAALT
jgi:cystathionine beta-lyase